MAYIRIFVKKKIEFYTCNEKLISEIDITHKKKEQNNLMN